MIHGKLKDLIILETQHHNHFIKLIILEDYQNLKDFKILMHKLEIVLEVHLDLEDDYFV